MILPGKAAFYEKCHSPNVPPPLLSASCPVSTFGVFKRRQLLCGGEEMVAADGGRHAHLRPLWALLGSPQRPAVFTRRWVLILSGGRRQAGAVLPLTAA